MLVDIENIDGPNQTAPVVSVCSIVLKEHDIKIKKHILFYR